MPVLPRPPERVSHRLEQAGGLRVLPVVLDDRRPVGPDRAAAAACGQHRWPRRAPRGPSPPPSAGCDLLPGCWRDRLGRAAPRVPAAPDRVRPVPALGHSRCLAADPRRPPRPGPAARRPGARTDRGDHRLACWPPLTVTTTAPFMVTT